MPLPRRLPLSLLLAPVALSGILAGCAPPPPALRVRSADLAGLGPITLERPVIVEFEEGDVIPLDFTLDGPFMKSPEGAPPIPLRVVRHFFLRIDKDGLKSSLDGEHFDWKPAAPGQFQVGLGVTKEGPKARIAIRTPTPPGLGK